MSEQQPNLSNTTFLEIATRALSRGLRICPVHPSEKRGVLHNQFTHPATTLSEVNQLAKDFSTYGVGAVGKCRRDGFVIFDTDAPGVVERFTSETGTTLPETYTVNSQPKNKPWKRHFYFQHTAYSYEKFGGTKAREIRLRDLSQPPVDGKYPGLFDVIGSGKGGFVVAEGSRHPKGETYTGNGVLTIAPIPDALVDWILKERDDYRAESARLRERLKREMTNAVASGKQIKTDYVRMLIKSRVCSFASLGIRKSKIVRLVQDQIIDYFEDGERLARELEPKIKKEVDSPNVRWGRPREDMIPRQPTREEVIKGLLKPPDPRTVRHQTIFLAVGSIRVDHKGTIKTSHARDIVNKALTQGRTRQRPLPQGNAGSQALSRALKEAGFESAGYAGNDRLWRRM